MDFSYHPEPSAQLPAHIPDSDDNKTNTNSGIPDSDISEDGSAGPSSGRMGQKPGASLLKCSRKRHLVSILQQQFLNKH